jgi:hypothetical protein
MAYTTHTAAVRRSEEEERIFRADFAAGSRLATSAKNGISQLSYDVVQFPFDDHIKRLLAAKELLEPGQNPPLEKLHEALPEAVQALDVSEINDVSRRFYDQDEAFLALYGAFLRDVIRPIVGTDFLYQSTPTIRFHFPRQRGFNWKPRYHSDIMLGHPPQEINIWIPLTRAFSTNTMRLTPLAASLELMHSVDLDFARFVDRVQTDSALGQACERASRPLELEFGQFVAFDARCLHATQYNVTESSRVSIDFRILPIGEYEASRLDYRGTGRMQMRFARGHYYASKTAGEA